MDYGQCVFELSILSELFLKPTNHPSSSFVLSSTIEKLSSAGMDVSSGLMDQLPIEIVHTLRDVSILTWRMYGSGEHCWLTEIIIRIVVFAFSPFTLSFQHC